MTSTFTGLVEGREPITLFEFASRVMSKWLAKVASVCSTSALFAVHGRIIPVFVDVLSNVFIDVVSMWLVCYGHRKVPGGRDVRQGRWHG